MKYLLILNLLLLHPICSGMGLLKTLKKKVEVLYSPKYRVSAITSVSPTEQKEHLTASENVGKIRNVLTDLRKDINDERLLVYQITQKQNVNGALLSLICAGVSKFTANQSHPSGDAYFNFSMATWFSLGITAAFTYKFCTTPLPVQHMAQIEQKK